MSGATAFHHKNIRLPAEAYLGRRSYFVTLCFEKRRALGTNARIAEWLIATLRKYAAACEFHIHAYCVMPDHVHVLAAGAADESNLTKLVEGFKQETGREFERRCGRRLWQFKYYDHVLRGAESADRVAWYIWLNPVRKGLCSTPAEYPFSGSFTEVGKRLFKGPAAIEWMPSCKTQSRAKGRGATSEP